MEIVPITLAHAKEFVAQHHRHHRPPVGHKFSIGLSNGERLVGVAIASRPVARALDDGRTLEITRTCTDGTKNANSMLYGAIWRCAKAMGYKRVITYTQDGESGASLRAAGWTIDTELPARGSWAQCSVQRQREDKNGGIARTRWQIRSGANGGG